MTPSPAFKVLHLDENHPYLLEGLKELGCINELDYQSPKSEILQKIGAYDGLILRSRIPIDQEFLEKAERLKFIGRLGAGLENIDVAFAKSKGVFLAAAPEGNRNAVGEHTLGMLLSLYNKLHTADRDVRSGIWDREANRGWELEGKTVGIFGYGNMGKAFAKKLQGFDVEVLCFDLVGGKGDENARQVGIMEFNQRCDVVSLHIPQTETTLGLVNTAFLEAFHKPIWLLNTARGKVVVTEDLVTGLKSGKVLGAGLDVLEYESTSFENQFDKNALPEAFSYLLKADNVLLSPHVAGWSRESHFKLARTVIEKIEQQFFKP